MKIEVFVLCDAATNYQGKLNILGTFDTINSGSIPLVYPQCSVATRIRFSLSEEGEHKMIIDFLNASRKSIMQPLHTNIKVFFSKEDMSSTSINLILNIQGLKIDNFGEFTIKLTIDDKYEHSIPLFIKEVPVPVIDAPSPNKYN